ncbi:SDR family oxidoreductase [Kitasatospora sp. NPDC004745]|uniref:SDR family oxidoreductase n=1 Tax=unclassified Kitasatospora TaxID=2633591 RepID=UPI0033E1935A
MARGWLVTGCSSGLGRAVAEAAAAAGDTVIAGVRRPEALADLADRYPDRIVPVVLDVREPAHCEAAVGAAVELLDGLDVLVNNAGNGLFGAVEEVGDAELRDQLETLVVGPWRLARLALPVMRGQGGGHIVNVSSLAGRMAFPGLAAYVTGKYALEGMTQALAVEAAPFGIRVTAVEPGGYATRYGSSLTDAADRSAHYRELTEPMRDQLRVLAELPGVGRPEDFARLLLRIVAEPGPLPVRIPVGPDSLAFVSAAGEAAAAELEAVRTLLREPSAPH